MADRSPSEVLLRERGSLELFPDRSRKHYPAAVSTAEVDARRELQVLVLLRDVRDESQPRELRAEWLNRAHVLARALSPHAWFDVFSALVRHDTLLGETARASGSISDLIALTLPRPVDDIIYQCSRLRDGLFRSVRALRLPLLARTIGLAAVDRIDTIVAEALADRTMDDRSRLPALAQLTVGLLDLERDPGPIVALLAGAIRAPEVADMQRADWGSSWGIENYGRLFGLLALAADRADDAAEIAAACSPDEQAYFAQPRPKLSRAIAGARRKLRTPFRLELSPVFVADAVFEWDRPPAAP